MCPSDIPPERALKHALIQLTPSCVSQLACSLALWLVCDQCLFPFLPLPLCLSSFAFYFSIIHNFLSPWKDRKFNFEEKGVFEIYLVMVMVTLYMVNPSANIIK